MFGEVELVHAAYSEQHRGTGQVRRTLTCFVSSHTHVVPLRYVLYNTTFIRCMCTWIYAAYDNAGEIRWPVCFLCVFCVCLSDHSHSERRSVWVKLEISFAFSAYRLMWMKISGNVSEKIQAMYPKKFRFCTSEWTSDDAVAAPRWLVFHSDLRSTCT